MSVHKKIKVITKICNFIYIYITHLCLKGTKMYVLLIIILVVVVVSNNLMSVIIVIIQKNE